MIAVVIDFRNGYHLYRTTRVALFVIVPAMNSIPTTLALLSNTRQIARCVAQMQAGQNVAATCI